ncbi:hypothetical protein DMN91_001841 [Ooceraea biroi]|uniref:Mitochondrial proton/calcium exchanger protein n=1 Tax=Ooceraea biroi TaxID=2015173 RepID=A0A026W0U3_OOCBI|nr:LETM1 domain-containing protein LETM2, mitochondrial [Ooceraea biroi]EZA48684.1 LETM1 and EF-hand domain-containing protein anon-60Da, mitochondrial [Ooceraea biroi]RLU25684.1 hypothetical protein DMN91_001841 [Ooceraea biroi]
MNALIHTKTMMTGYGGVIRRYSSSKLWHNTNCMTGGIALVYTDLRDSRSLLLHPMYIVPATYVNNMTYPQIRTLYVTPSWRGQEPSSKIEETVKTIKEEKELKDKMSESLVKTEQPKKAVAKLSIWQRVKGEILHYYHGFRLLGLDMKVSAKLIWRILHGKELSRREHRLLIKTTGDMFRLIPFSVFIIVPFMEFLLPVAIKLFPGMLPSTFQTATEKEDKLKQALKVKIEMAKFLQKTLDEMAVQSSDHRSEKAKEFVEFFYKIRSTGAVATNEEIMKFSKLFEDEITLDSLSRPQLIALCRVLDVQALGTTNFLRFLLRMRLRSLTADDKLIEKEGIDTLTRAELQQACRARGMRAYGLPENRLREQVSQWLDLSLNKKVPPSLLLLSRALMIPEATPMSDKLKATISALPDAVVARTKGAIGEKEGKVDHRTNIEIIKMEERKIEEERKEQKDIKPQPIISEPDTKEDEITATDVKVLEQALDSIGKDNKKMVVEKEEIKELKEEMAEYQEDIKELYQIKAEAKGQADIENLKISKGSKRLFNKVNKMISKMDAVLLELEQSEKKVKERLKSLGPDEKKDTKDVEELVKIDELVAAIKQIQNVPDEHRLKRIVEILGKIDDDHDGAIKIEDVLKVVELIGKEDVKLSKEQVDELIELMDKEEELEVDEQIQKLEKDAKAAQKEKNITATHKSTVPATPVTTEPGYGKEELVDDAATESSKSYATSSVEEAKQKSAAVLKSNPKSDEGKNPPLTSGVPPTTKKAEGSKQL